MMLYRFIPGDSPLLVSVPHSGTYLSDAIQKRLTTEALTLPDTDWHVEKLYDFAPSLGASMLVATHSRYVVDLNRDPQGIPLYLGSDNSEICPLRTFANQSIYRSGVEPDAEEIKHRITQYWQPYHDKLCEQLAVLKARFGYAVLLDAHSIKSEVPRFFAGRLPDFSLGTADGSSANARLTALVMQVLQKAVAYSAVLNGRFKGGYITRHHGRPEEAIHALQLEIAQAAYMDETPPYSWREQTAHPLQQVLQSILRLILSWRP